MAEKNDRPLMMGAKRFANEIREGYDANLRYCFILGAGASVASGIPLAKQIMAEWRVHLLQYSDKEMRRIAAYAGLDYDDKVAPLLVDGYVPRSDDYFTFYDLRFAGMPVQAYAYLQSLMDKARPSFGYYALAVLLEDYQNKLVVTTNFDSLVEETLSLTHAKRPLVVGHESLAPFLGSTENRNRATVVKVHRDLLMRPKNGEDEVNGMDAPLEGSLRKALASYVPIVVGYAGADQSLMSLLEDMHFDSMYWCVMEGSEDDVDDRVKRLLRKRVSHGHLVHIKGFDQAMYLLLDCFVADREFRRPDTRIREYMQGRLDDYAVQLKAVTESLAVLKRDGGAPSGADDPKRPPNAGPVPSPDSDAQPSGDDGTVPLDTLERLSETDSQAGSDGHSPSKDATKAILAFVRGVQAHNEGRYDEALAEFDEAVRLDPESARYHDSRSATLHAMGRYDEALAESDEAVRLEPGNAEYHRSRGVTLRRMGRLDESLGEIDRAIELAPDMAIAHGSRALTLREMGRQEEALAEEAKEQELSGA